LTGIDSGASGHSAGVVPVRAVGVGRLAYFCAANAFKAVNHVVLQCNIEVLLERAAESLHRLCRGEPFHACSPVELGKFLLHSREHDLGRSACGCERCRVDLDVREVTLASAGNEGGGTAASQGNVAVNKIALWWPVLVPSEWK